MEKISIIIPARNEEKRNIGRTLEQYYEFFKDLVIKKKLDFEIIVVVNNSTDKTEKIVDEYSKKHSKIKYLNLKRGGKGFAIIEGFKDSIKRKNDLIGFVDADMSTKPKEFYQLVLNIKDYDGIIASRYIKGAIVKPKPQLKRIIASRVFNLIVRVILRLQYRDTQCGAKLFKKSSLEEILPDLKMSQWAFDIDLLYSLKKRNFKIKEIPTKWSDANYSTLNFISAGPRMILAVIRLRLLNSRFKKLAKLYDKIIGNIIMKIF